MSPLEDINIVGHMDIGMVRHLLQISVKLNVLTQFPSWAYLMHYLRSKFRNVKIYTYKQNVFCEKVCIIFVNFDLCCPRCLFNSERNGFKQLSTSVAKWITQFLIVSSLMPFSFCLITWAQEYVKIPTAKYVTASL